MNQALVYPLLAQLMAIVAKSFPQYLRYSRPYVPPGRENVMETLEQIASDQDVLTDRIGHMLTELGAPLRTGEFPMEYTDTHDLGIEYQLGSAIEYQQQDIQSIEKLIGELQPFPAAKTLAEETLGMAKGHLESLQELLPEPSGV
ncbi:MAG: hypothetical protein SH868_13700 [Bythopirellula sp.]|nr:hypothetical protein [Bythopirellula sp.]